MRDGFSLTGGDTYWTFRANQKIGSKTLRPDAGALFMAAAAQKNAARHKPVCNRFVF
jgi:hypothetical protein